MKQLRRIAVAFVGGIVLVVGIAMLVLPGPAVVVIPAGLAILATEFAWARRLLHRVRGQIERGARLFRRRPPSDPSPYRPPTSRGAPTDGSSSSQLKAS